MRSHAARLFQVNGWNQLANNGSISGRLPSVCHAYNSIVQRYASSKNQSIENVDEADVHAKMYKPSTEKQHTHVPNDLKGGQAPETVINAASEPMKGSGKVWSLQDADSIHVSPLAGAASDQFVSSASPNGQSGHQTTVHSTQGKVNIADPFTTHKLQPQVSTAQLAEAAAASAFEPFAPDTPIAASPTADATFAPKISSNETYSSTTSPTAHFDSATPMPQGEPKQYETASRSKVYGGQDTTAATKKHPKENPFNTKETIKRK